MTEGPQVAIVAQGPMDELRRKLRVLEREGFEARIVSPPEGGG